MELFGYLVMGGVIIIVFLGFVFLCIKIRLSTKIISNIKVDPPIEEDLEQKQEKKFDEKLEQIDIDEEERDRNIQNDETRLESKPNSDLSVSLISALNLILNCIQSILFRNCH